MHYFNEHKTLFYPILPCQHFIVKQTKGKIKNGNKIAQHPKTIRSINHYQQQHLLVFQYQQSQSSQTCSKSCPLNQSQLH